LTNLNFRTSSLSGAMMKAVVPRNGKYLSLEDVSENAYIDDDVHTCPTRVISLENTLNGMVMPLEEVKRIAGFAREHNIKLHLDGARLWEAAASGAGSLTEYCAYFDTVTLCFSKGLGAPIGSILVGSSEHIKHARWVRKSIGGGLRQAGVVAAPARVAVDVTFGKSPSGEDGLLKATHDCAKRIEQLWSSMGGILIHPVETNMCWLDLRAAGCSPQEFNEYGKQVGLKLLGERLVIHYQIAENINVVLPLLEVIFRKIFATNAGSKTQARQNGEMNIYAR
jgi:threonine aldolase